MWPPASGDAAVRRPPAGCRAARWAARLHCPPNSSAPWSLLLTPSWYPIPCSRRPGNLDLLKVSLPVKLFEPRSYLQKLADPWVRESWREAPRGILGVRDAGGCSRRACCALPHLLSLPLVPRRFTPASCGWRPRRRTQWSASNGWSRTSLQVRHSPAWKHEDHTAAGCWKMQHGCSCRRAVQRAPCLAHMAHALPPAGFHHVFTRWAKPFNPILGETWQAALPDGSQIALEQVRGAGAGRASRIAQPAGAVWPQRCCRVLASRAAAPLAIPCTRCCWRLPGCRSATTRPSRHSSSAAPTACTPSAARGAQRTVCAGALGIPRSRCHATPHPFLQCSGSAPPPLCARSQPSVSYKTNAVKTTARGYRSVQFHDGGRVEVHFPAYYLRGEGREPKGALPVVPSCVESTQQQRLQGVLA